MFALIEFELYPPPLGTSRAGQEASALCTAAQSVLLLQLVPMNTGVPSTTWKAVTPGGPCAPFWPAGPICPCGPCGPCAPRKPLGPRFAYFFEYFFAYFLTIVTMLAPLPASALAMPPTANATSAIAIPYRIVRLICPPYR